MKFIIELWTFLRVRKKLGLLPIVLILVVAGWIFVASSGSTVAPYIYAIF